MLFLPMCSWVRTELLEAFALCAKGRLFGGKRVMSRTNVLVLVITAALAATSAAQAPDSGSVFIGGGMGAPVTKGAMVGLSVDAMDAAPVKGAPFCASITTEHTQLFADGN